MKVAVLAHCRRKLLLGAEAVTPVSATQSSLAFTPWAVAANGVTTSTGTLTVKDASGTAMAGRTASGVVTETVLVDAATSTLAASPAAIADDGVARSFVTLTVLATDGEPLVGIPAANCVLAVSGTGNTVTQPTGVTDATGQITGSFVSTGIATKAATFTVCGLAVTASASVEVTGTPSSTAPTYNAALATLVFAGDGADARYASTTAAGAAPVSAVTFVPQPSPAYDGGAVTSAVSIETGKGGTGKALRITYPTSGSQQGGRWAVIQQGVIAAAKTNYYRAWIRFGGTNTSEIAVKFNHFDLAGVSGGAQPQFSTHNRLPYNATDEGKHQYWQFVDDAFTDDGTYPTGADQGTQPVGPYMQNLFDGQWHEFVFAYKTHASAGVLDGLARMWIDGVKVIDVSQEAVGVTPGGGYKQWCSQAMVDNLHVNVGVEAYYGLWFGGTMTTTNRPEWYMELNVGDGLAASADTFLWWTD